MILLMGALRIELFAGESSPTGRTDQGKRRNKIIRVGQVHDWDLFLVPVDHRLRQRRVHQSARVLQALYRDGWRGSRQVSDPFVVDHFRPAPFDEVINSHLHNDVPVVERIDDATGRL